MSDIYGQYRVPEHPHSFDPISGWCGWVGVYDEKPVSCGLRDDGRKVNKYGTVLNPGPSYSVQELEVFRQRAWEA